MNSPSKPLPTNSNTYGNTLPLLNTHQLSERATDVQVNTSNTLNHDTLNGISDLNTNSASGNASGRHVTQLTPVVANASAEQLNFHTVHQNLDELPQTLNLLKLNLNETSQNLKSLDERTVHRVDQNTSETIKANEPQTEASKTELELSANEQTIANGTERFLNSFADIQSTCIFKTLYTDTGLEGVTHFINGCLKAGANINAENKKGQTLLQCACYWGYAEIVIFLIQNGANFTDKLSGGMTPLHIASYAGHEHVVTLLIDKKADIHVWSDSGHQAIHFAALKGHLAIVALLLDTGVSIHTKANGTPLIILAAQAGYTDLVVLLLKRGAYIDADDNDECTAFLYACLNNDEQLTKILLDNGSNIETYVTVANYKRALHFAAFNGQLNIAQLLLDRGADMYAKSETGECPLHYAAFAGHKTLVELFLSRKMDVNVQDDQGMTPLHHAGGRGCTEILELLLDNGADIHATDRSGMTVLHYAVMFGQKESVKILLDRGADINKQAIAEYNKVDDCSGPTALHAAACRGNMELVKVLLDRGADIRIQDHFKHTAQEQAIEKGYTEVAQLLSEREGILGSSAYETSY